MRTLFPWNGSGEPDADALMGCRRPDAVEVCFSESSNCRYAQSLPTSQVSSGSMPVIAVAAKASFRSSHGRPSRWPVPVCRHQLQSATPAMLTVELSLLCVVQWWTLVLKTRSVCVWSSKREKVEAKCQGRGAWPVSGDQGRRASRTVSTFQLQGSRCRRSIVDCFSAARISAVLWLGQLSDIVGHPE